MAPSIDRETLLPVLLAALTIAAIGVAAATLTSAQPNGGAPSAITGEPQPSTDPPVEQPEPPGNQGSSVLPDLGDRGSIQIGWCVEVLAGPLGIPLVLLALGLVLYGIYRRYNLSTAFLGAYGVLPPTLIAYFSATQCLGGGESPGPGPGPKDPGQPIGPTPGIEGFQLSPAVTLGLLGLAFVGAVLAAVVVSRGDDAAGEVVPPEDVDGEMEGLARAAGRAADRIAEANADVDNAVYRAWDEMTTYVDVSDPETSTPGEFAEAAVDAGMDRGDVAELTRLFEEVRYGEAAPDSREERSLAVLRRVESAYGDQRTK